MTQTFAVSLHPFTRDMDLASFDDDMISDLDCFHPSAKSHALTATALWCAPDIYMSVYILHTSHSFCPLHLTTFFLMQSTSMYLNTSQPCLITSSFSLLPFP